MNRNLTTLLKSKAKTIKIYRDLPTAIIGERINSTGHETALKSFSLENSDIVRKDALNQVAAGSAVLDINAGVPGSDESTLIKQITKNVTEVLDGPMCIDSDNPDVLH